MEQLRGESPRVLEASPQTQAPPPHDRPSAAEAAQAWPVLASAGYVNWFGKRGQSRSGGVIRSAAALGRMVEVMEGWNLYVCLNPARPWGIKPRSRDVFEYRQLLIDLDPIDAAPDPKRATYNAMRTLDEMFHNPAWVHLDSGRGEQLWLQFEPCPILSPVEGENIERHAAALLRLVARGLEPIHGCRVDPCTSDLGRIARLPGSVNQKTGRLARIIPQYLNNRDPLGIGALLDVEAPAPPERQRQVRCKDLTNLFALLPHLTWRATEFLKLGVGEPGRHAACVAAARSLKELGVSRMQAEAWLFDGAERCRPQLDEQDVVRIMRDTWNE